ncbi:response regulator [Paenibacillus turpanensis]|uniref:response regulator n=1 Tax=Paenibacillus turpanensis TaxID=2689078 RepID=UPI00140CB815|nr:response regulator [Paenibacillus turpanensis]
METVSLLLVDDLAENLLALEEVLADPGYRLICVRSGREALKQVLLHDFAVIILDVHMPEMDGFETAKLITSRKKSKDIPIIFLTASEYETEYVTKGYDVGAFDYITKPFHPEQLRKKVERLSNLYREKMAVEQRLETAHREQIAEERLRVAGEIAVGVAHEIRNPITTIQGYLQLAKQTGRQIDDDKIALMMEELKQTNSFLANFIQLAPNKRLNKQPLTLNGLVEQKFPEILRKALDMGLNAKFLPGNCGSLEADEQELSMLLEQLTSNAMEAMSEGTVTIRTYMAGLDHVLAVRDEGCGLSGDAVEKLGTPFYTTKEDRRGLGMAICFGIVDRHGGRIHVSSSEKGTEFLVFLR